MEPQTMSDPVPVAPEAALEALVAAFAFTEGAIAGVRADQWSAPTPCPEWDVRQLVSHVTGAVLAMGQAASGQEAPGGERPDFSAEPDPAAAFRTVADAALAAWPGAFDSMVTLGPARLPGAVAVGINLLDTLGHGWDIAVATGQPHGLPEPAAQIARQCAGMILTGDLRAQAGFGPVVELGADASATDALVAFLGRQPR